MANEKSIEKTNEKTAEKANENAVTSPKTSFEEKDLTSEESAFNSIFDVDDVEEDLDEDESVISFRDNAGRVYGDCGFLRRDKASQADDGYQYHNYYVKFNTLINGKPFTQTLYMSLVESFKLKHQMLDEFYGDEKAMPLYIHRSERISRRRNGKETVSIVYTPQLRFKDDYGSSIVFDLKPNSSNTFKTFTEILKQANRIE